MSEQLAASTVRPPSFGERDLETIAASHERSGRGSEPLQGGPADRRDLLLVAERRPGAISLVDTTRHERIGRVEDVGRAPHSLAFHPDLPDAREGAFAYVQSRQGWVSKIDLVAGDRVARVRGGTSGRAIATSADGAYVLAGYYNPNHVVVLDGETLEPRHRIPTHAVDPDGQSVPSRVGTVRDVPGERCFLVALKDAGTVWFVDYDDESFPIVDEVGVGRVLHDGVFSPDGRYFFLASQAEERLYALDVRERTVVGTVPTAGPPHPSPGGIDAGRDLAFTATVMTDAVTAWDRTRLEPVAEIDVPGDGMFLASHPDADYLWGDVVFDEGGRDDRLFLIDPDELAVERVVDTSAWAAGRSLHPEFTRDGESVYVSLWDAGKLLVFDSETAEPVAEIDGLETPTGTFLGARAGDP